LQPHQQFSQHFQGGPEHSLVYDEDNGSPVQTCDFNYSEIDRNVFGVESDDAGAKTVSFSDMSAALSLVLLWIQGSKAQCKAGSVASRALSLLYMLDPVNSRFGSLDDIGKATGLTRAAISQNLVAFREEIGLAIAMGGKTEGSRENYSRSQRFAVAAGTHSSCRRER
jgi:hypothetical protein